MQAGKSMWLQRDAIYQKIPLECALCGAMEAHCGTMAEGAQETHSKKCQDNFVGQHFNGRPSYGEADPNPRSWELWTRGIRSATFPHFTNPLSLSLKLQWIPRGTALPWEVLHALAEFEFHVLFWRLDAPRRSAGLWGLLVQLWCFSLLSVR